MKEVYNTLYRCQWNSPQITNK